MIQWDGSDAVEKLAEADRLFEQAEVELEELAGLYGLLLVKTQDAKYAGAARDTDLLSALVGFIRGHVAEAIDAHRRKEVMTR